MRFQRIQVLTVLLVLTSECPRAKSQDQMLPVTVGRAQEIAPVESSKGSEVLADSLVKIPDVEDLDSQEPDSLTNLEAKDWAFVAVFEGPCHFSERLNDVARSLVIYEGMQVAVKRDGTYEVSMIAEVPSTPVVMRMQLRVSELVGNERVDHGTITLVPIVIETSQETTHQQPSNTVRIRRSGYSHLLSRLLTANESSFSDLSFSRLGVARFGSVPEAAKYSLSDRSKTAETATAN